MGILNKAFFNIGYYSASNPGTVCWGALMLVLISGLGFINFQITVIYIISSLNRTLPKTCGSLRSHVQILNKPILTLNLDPSSELILSSLPLTSQKRVTLIFLISLI